MNKKGIFRKRFQDMRKITVKENFIGSYHLSGNPMRYPFLKAVSYTAAFK